MKFWLPFLFLSFGLYAQHEPAKYVNPFIGTGGHGHTFPGAVVPFGMVQLSPDTRIDGSWDGCSGYHYSDSVIYGFSQTHLSGTGCSDYGDIMLMPMTGKASVDSKKYACSFSHKNEDAKAGYYHVKLNNGVDVSLTATARTGIHKYEFPKDEVLQLILDLTHRDETLESYVKITGDRTIEGYRASKAWASNQIIYFSMEFSDKMDWEVFINDQSQKGVKLKDNYYPGKNVKAILRFPDSKGKALMVKVGISQVSAEGAKMNRETETKSWNFDEYVKSAESLWNQELSKISVTSDNKDKLSVFYTALYHCMIHPSLASDVDGQYRGRDMKIHQTDGFDYYTVFSLWDTYRGLHPLLTLIDKKRTSDFIKTFIAEYEQGGRLPVWELSSNETDCMIGYHAVPVIADAYAKGVTGFDAGKALEAMKNSAMEDRLGLKAYKEKGVISIDDEHESVSKTLEYAYDDWCIAQMAKQLGKEDDYNYFIKRSKSWRNVFDVKSGFVHARKNGEWQEPFDPREVNNNFTEANSFQYSFYAPQDVKGLMEAYGGKDGFKSALDRLFTTENKTTGRTQADITGLIGQYAHGNEPSHHMVYLYNYVGDYPKTVKYIDKICNEFYKNDPDGLIGNEDCGQMSAWYVLSSLGFYSVCPGSTDFVIGKPQFKEASIKLENGKNFNISMPIGFTEAMSDKVSFELNGKKNNQLFFKYKDIKNGGSLKFVIGYEPQTSFTVPVSEVVCNNFIPLPVVKVDEQLFMDSTIVKLLGNGSWAELMYRTDSLQPFIKYIKPFVLNKTSVVEVYAISNGVKSQIVSCNVYKRPNNWDISIKHPYNKQYTAGGDKGVIDGLRGDANWRKGGWQGYQPYNFEAVIDLKKETLINKVKVGCLRDTRSWILFPNIVEVYVSNDNKDFKLLGQFLNTLPADDYNIMVQDLGGSIDTKGIKYRYLKVIAENPAVLPEWHLSRGEEAFIFVDEVIVE